MTRNVRFGICTDQNMPWPKTVERWRLVEELNSISLSSLLNWPDVQQH